MISQEQIVSTLNIGIHSVEMLIAKQNCSEIFPINEYTAITEKDGNAGKNNSRFSAATFNYILQAIKEMKEIAEENNVCSMLVAAASNLRTMENRTKLFSECRKIIDIYPQLLNTREETLLIFMGAVSGIPAGSPVIVCFLGTENLDIIFGESLYIYKAFSFPLGYMSIFRKFNIKEKISLRNQLIIQNFIRKNLKTVRLCLNGWEHKNKAKLIITGVPAINYIAMISKQPLYSYKSIEFFNSNKKELIEMFKIFNKMGSKERVNLPGVEKDITDFLSTGMLILQTLLSSLNLNNFTITPRGLQLGLIRYMIDEEIRRLIKKAAKKVDDYN